MWKLSFPCSENSLVVSFYSIYMPLDKLSMWNYNILYHVGRVTYNTCIYQHMLDNNVSWWAWLYLYLGVSWILWMRNSFRGKKNKTKPTTIHACWSSLYLFVALMCFHHLMPFHIFFFHYSNPCVDQQTYMTLKEGD